MSHTPEPWIAFYANRDDKETILDSNEDGCGGYFATLHGTKETQRANAARIVACVNGCAGLNPAAYQELIDSVGYLIGAAKAAGVISPIVDKAERAYDRAIAQASA